jgi:protein TonB
VLLVHAGAIVAIMSGLEIRTPFDVPPPITTRTLPVTPPIQKPIEHFDPKLTEFALTQPQEPVLPQSDPERITPPIVREEPTTNEFTGDKSGTEAVVTEARSDPRHPLTQPSYPAQSRRLGEEGSVQLLVFVQPNGRISEAQVAVSSGFPRLDDAALREALRSWRFLPNTVDGVATAGWSRIAVTFRLKN